MDQVAAESLLSDDNRISPSNEKSSKCQKSQALVMKIVIAIETIIILVLAGLLGFYLNKIRKENTLFYPTLKSNPLFVFCHGLYGTGTNVWFPYAFTTISEHDCDFISPDMPNPASPQYEEWKPVLLDRINSKWDKKQPLILAGHSLGGYTILKVLSECANETWAKNVKGVFLVSPVITWKFTPNLGNYTEIDFEPVVKMDAKFRHIYNVNDQIFDPRNSEYLTQVMKDANVDYSVKALDTTKYDSHFGGFKHYSVKEINEGLIDLLKEIDPDL